MVQPISPIDLAEPHATPLTTDPFELLGMTDGGIGDDAETMPTAAVPPRSTRRRRAVRPHAGTRARSARFPLALVETPLRAVTGLRGAVILLILLIDSGIGGSSVLSIDLFLVLLGFSVTQGMLKEHHGTGTLRLIRFYLGRLKPLVPVLALTIGISLIAILQLGTYDELDRFSKQSLASLLLINNWEEIGAEALYSDGFDRLSPLSHLWVVAVIEQFFRVWPLLIFAVLALGRALSRRFGRRAGPTAWQWSPITATLVLGLSTAGAVVSALLARSSIAAAGAERTYLGTDTHAVALFAGAAAAAISYLVVQRRSRLGAKRRVPRRPGLTRLMRIIRSVAVSVLSIVAIVTLVMLSTQITSYTDPWLYSYGFALAAAIGAILVLTVTSPVNQVNRFFHFTPFVGMGTAAYTLFIVHLPIFWIIHQLAPTDSPLDVLVLGVPATLLVGTLLHHMAMEPLRRLRWNKQAIIAIAAVVVATTTALWYLPAAKLAAPLGTGDITVLALGDTRANNLSTALDYTENDDEEATSPDLFTIIPAGTAGCGITGAAELRTADGRVSTTPASCAGWEDRWANAIATAQPDIVIVDVSGDARSQRVDGVWTDLTDDATAERYRAELEKVATMAGPHSKLLLANARLHSGDATTEQAAAFNEVLEEVVAENPRLGLLDLQSEVCSDTACTTKTMMGDDLYTDGRVLFSDAGKQQIAPWLSAEVLTAYRGATNAEATAR